MKTRFLVTLSLIAAPGVCAADIGSPECLVGTFFSLGGSVLSALSIEVSHRVSLPSAISRSIPRLEIES